MEGVRVRIGRDNMGLVGAGAFVLTESVLRTFWRLERDNLRCLSSHQVSRFNECLFADAVGQWSSNRDDPSSVLFERGAMHGTGRRMRPGNAESEGVRNVRILSNNCDF